VRPRDGRNHTDMGAGIGTLGWILVVAVAWLAVAAIVGVLVGRMIRERDRQVPPAPDTTPMPHTHERGVSWVAGRGRPRRR
jgi:hypothetical protein